MSEPVSIATQRLRPGFAVWLPVLLAAALMTGCGKTVQRTATEQLILSDAVDRVVRSINFTPLAGMDCYIDTTYLKPAPNTQDKVAQIVNSDYVVSSVRNQLMAAGCRIVLKKEEAEFIIEPRLGAMGADLHEVMYGIPSTNVLSAAATVVPASPSVPVIPEISVARRNDHIAAAKLAVFAYDAKTGLPVWQSGMSLARSEARDTWLFGIGPFRSGTIYSKPHLRSTSLRSQLVGDHDGDQPRQEVSLGEEFLFSDRLEEARTAAGGSSKSVEKALLPPAPAAEPEKTAAGTPASRAQ